MENQPNRENIITVRNLNKAMDLIRKELGNCREDKESFPYGSVERFSLEAKIDGLIFSLMTLDKVKRDFIEEQYPL